MVTGTRLVQLEIPGQAEFVSVARLVVSSMAAERYELSDDRLDSLKLAVSEACVLAMGELNRPVGIECRESAGRLDVCVGPIASGSLEGIEPPGLPLISTLVDECVAESDAHGNENLRMTVFCELDRER